MRKHGLPAALAAGKHQPPVNSHLGSYLSPVQWREEAGLSQAAEGREGSRPRAVNFGQNGVCYWHLLFKRKLSPAM